MSSDFSVDSYSKKLQAGQAKLRRDARQAEIRKRRLEMSISNSDTVGSGGSVASQNIMTEFVGKVK